MADASSKKTTLELLDVGSCEEPYRMGFLVGQRFSDLIRSRVARDLILQQQLLPFARTTEAEPLIHELCSTNRLKFPRHWDELLGTAEGSGVPVLDILLLNFRKEILPFVPNPGGPAPSKVADDDDCSDVLVVNKSMAIAAHNEDANLAVVGHTYLVRAKLPNGLFFTAYTYAGELPSCAFGFNSHGLAFTLNSVPPTREEITAGGIGRNFISRDLLEATSLGDALQVRSVLLIIYVELLQSYLVYVDDFSGNLLVAMFQLQRIQSCNASVGHSYNLVDVRTRKILNVETASGNRTSIHEVGAKPFIHANMYLHLLIQQVQDDNSISRQRRAALLSADSKTEVLSILGDSNDEKYPIYMTGPTLYTLCTVLIDVDARTLSIYEGNPKKGEVSYVLPI